MSDPQPPAHLSQLFEPEARKALGVERRGLGELALPEGRVFACDPMAPAEKSALDQRLPSEGVQAEAFMQGDDVVAAVLRWSDDPPHAYTLAGHEDPSLNLDGEPGITVEVGAICFAGSGAAEVLFREEGDGDAAMELFDTGAQVGIVDVAEGLPMAVFSTGGDGGYYSWWAQDASGQTVALVVTISDPTPPAPVGDAPAPKPWWKFWG